MVHGGEVLARALPFFLGTIATEAALSELRHRRSGKPRTFFPRQAMSNLSAGALQTLLGLYYTSLLLAPYIWVRGWAEHLFWVPQVEDRPRLQHALAFVLNDFGYYWSHRAMHASNIGWASHVAHHNSPDFNYSTALRQGALEPLAMGWPFYLPLAALGVPPEIFWLHRNINSIIQVRRAAPGRGSQGAHVAPD